MATYDVFLRNNVALRRRRNFGQKRLKMPEKAPKQPILLGIAEHSTPPMASSLIPATKSGELVSPICVPTCFTFSQIARNLRYSARLAYLVASFLKSLHKAFLGLTRGYLQQKKRMSRHCQFLSAIPFITSVQPRRMSLLS